MFMRRFCSVLVAVLSFGMLWIYCTISIGEESTAVYAQRQAEFMVTCDGIALKPWEDENNNLYVFLPAYFDWNDTEIQVLNGILYIDGAELEERTSLSLFKKELPYSYRLTFQETEKTGNLIFAQSGNVGTVFLETESGTMEQIDSDKEYREGGRILIADKEGDIEHIGLLNYIKSRGNATWNSDKKSYGIKLDEEVDLFGMGKAKDWILLSNVYDGSKMQNKLCFDMAQAVGLPYSVQAEWVDLYLNGAYHGSYLLCEKVEAGENRVEIGEGFLVERDYYYDQENGFITKDGNPFSLGYPSVVTQEELEEIADYIQKIEDAVLSEDLETAGEYLDWNSFVLRYVLDETVLNQDTGVTSMYFYKPEGEHKLYSGPVWDYDGCLGSGQMAAWMNHKIISATDIQNYKRESALTWYPVLYANEWFQSQVKEKYCDMIRPYLLNMLEDGIDQYADRIEKSATMDMLRWDYASVGAGHYESFENNIRYLKFFIAKRLEFLDEEWLGEDNVYLLPGTGETHTVTFQCAQKSVHIEIQDQERLLATPEELLEEGQWWYNKRDGLAFTPDLPILEDVVFTAK